MKNVRIYWEYHQMLDDGKYYDELVLETKNSIYILLTRKSR